MDFLANGVILIALGVAVVQNQIVAYGLDRLRGEMNAEASELRNEISRLRRENAALGGRLNDIPAVIRKTGKSPARDGVDYLSHNIAEAGI